MMVCIFLISVLWARYLAGFWFLVFGFLAQKIIATDGRKVACIEF